MSVTNAGQKKKHKIVFYGGNVVSYYKIPSVALAIFELRESKKCS